MHTSTGARGLIEMGLRHDIESAYTRFPRKRQTEAGEDIMKTTAGWREKAMAGRRKAGRKPEAGPPHQSRRRHAARSVVVRQEVDFGVVAPRVRVGVLVVRFEVAREIAVIVGRGAVRTKTKTNEFSLSAARQKKSLRILTRAIRARVRRRHRPGCVERLRERRERRRRP